MDDDRFEWHTKKTARNLAEHGITFEVACEVFDDPAMIDGPTTARITAKTATMPLVK